MRVLSLNNMLNDLEILEKRMQEPKIDFWIRQQEKEDRAKFRKCQSDLSIQIGKLRNARIEPLLPQLMSGEDDLKKGIDKLRREIAELDKIAEAIQAISNVINTLTSILAPFVPSPSK
ncbi:hypothetical protein NIES2104_10020 [Leptolyngbya sp. NIES-2104]|nr:hypothetical protein NIES2104_10020 [Leptolyngbya sp. NIES-2104]